MATIRAPHYRDTEQLLERDPIVQRLARDVREAPHSADHYRHPDSHTPRHTFMSAANSEYNRRGGTIQGHLGAVATALLSLAFDQPKRPYVFQFPSPDNTKLLPIALQAVTEVDALESLRMVFAANRDLPQETVALRRDQANAGLFLVEGQPVSGYTARHPEDTPLLSTDAVLLVLWRDVD